MREKEPTDQQNKKTLRSSNEQYLTDKRSNKKSCTESYHLNLASGEIFVNPLTQALQLLIKWKGLYDKCHDNFLTYGVFILILTGDLGLYRGYCNSADLPNKLNLFQQLLELIYLVQENYIKLSYKNKNKVALAGGINFSVNDINKELCGLIDDSRGETRVQLLYLLALIQLILSESTKNSDQYNLCIKQSLDYASVAHSLASNDNDKSIIINLIDISCKKNCKASARFKINLGLQNYKTAINTNDIKTMEQVYANLLNEEVSFSDLPEIPSVMQFYSDMAQAFINTNNNIGAIKIYYLALKQDKYHLNSLYGLLRLLMQEKESCLSWSEQARCVDSQIVEIQSCLDKAKVLSTVPSYILPLFNETIKGNLDAYEMLKTAFDTDKKIMQQLSDYIHCFSGEELNLTAVNTLYDIALFIKIGEINEPTGQNKREYTNRLFQLAASRNYPLAIYRLGRIAEENYDYETSKSYYKKAANLNDLEARFALISIYCREYKYGEARQYLSELSSSIAKEELEAHHKRINHLESLNTCYATNTSKNNTSIIYFDFDNTLMKSQDLSGTFYVLYPDGKAPDPDSIVSFYTGGKEEWADIFENLKKLGFLIGLCTARKIVEGKNCLLYKEFMKNFGDYFDPALMIFTEGKGKYRPLVKSCKSKGGSPSQSILVEDNQHHCEEAKACGFEVVRAENIVLDSETFAAFKQHLLQVAHDIKNECENSIKLNRHNLFSSSRASYGISQSDDQVFDVTTASF